MPPEIQRAFAKAETYRRNGWRDAAKLQARAIGAWFAWLDVAVRPRPADDE